TDGNAAGGVSDTSANAPGGMQVRVNGNGVKMTILSTGKVGIGTTKPGFLLHVNGSAGKPGGGTWSVASDRRLKKNIEPLQGSLDTLLQLRGVNFEYIDPVNINELPGKQIGMIAQDVERVFPDWVDENVDGYKHLTFRGFEALTIEALREMQRENDVKLDELRQEKDAEIEQLQEENQKLQLRLEALESMVNTLIQTNGDKK
ncbi:MAG: hypothetical protein GY869_32770, partial [Planctomycetes bacterium]|nr:hypothetical protein [Planctomycetota bacterium]